MDDHRSVFTRSIYLVLFALLLCFGAAAAEETVVLGKPFPDFTAVDTEGNAFSLSQALQDHEAVLINIWATWCPPCRAEMPFLNEAFDQYGDRVAFIALSREEEDTPEIIEAFRQELGLRFPMGRDEGSALYQALGGEGIPVTAVVDRFGNTVFVGSGSFTSVGEITRVLDTFLGEGYTETVPLASIPMDTSTRAFPVFPQRMIHVENETARCFLFHAGDDPNPQPVYVVENDVAQLRLEIPSSDNPALVSYYNMSNICILQEILDADRGAYFFDQPMPDPQSGTFYVYGCLSGGSLEDPDQYGIYLIPSEEYIEPLAEEMRSWGYDITWEVGDDVQETPALAQSYRLNIVDQHNDPVPGVMVNFCTDTSCTTLQSDESGAINFDSEPNAYHIQLLKVPEGYSFDPDFELNLDHGYGEWLLRICKK